MRLRKGVDALTVALKWHFIARQRIGWLVVDSICCLSIHFHTFYLVRDISKALGNRTQYSLLITCNITTYLSSISLTN